MTGQDLTRPRASLRRIVEDLGTTLIDIEVGVDDDAGEVSEVVIYDPFDDQPIPPDSMMLGVGVRDDADVIDVLKSPGMSGASALFVKIARPVSADVVASVEASGVALLGLNHGVSWSQLAAVLRSLTSEGNLQNDAGALDEQQGDLFTLANALTALLDAPVTIEDRNSRVVAFSGRQDEADPSRVESILGRQVPSRFTKRYDEQGVFRQLYSSDRPVFVDDSEDDFGEPMLPRVAMAVRAGEEILGSIWVAVRNELDADRTRALQDAAKLVALEMMKIRAGGHVDRRLRADLVAAALTGKPEAAAAVDRLGLRGLPVLVMALAISDVDDDGPDVAARQLAERQRLGDALALHLSAVLSKSVAAVVGDYCFGVIAVHAGAGDPEESAVREANNFLERVGSTSRVVIGIGSVATDVAGLARSRHEAERAVRVLRSRSDGRQVACLSDVQTEALVQELGDSIASRREVLAGPVARLADYDADHNSHLVETLSAWLDHFGDVTSAAKSVYAHPNTFRYRLRRVAEIGELDLHNRDARFSAMLQLQLWSQLGDTSG